MSLDASTTGIFGAPVYSPRAWNGTTHHFDGTARWRAFGEGCAGTAGSPTIAPAARSLPPLGTNFTVEFGNLAAPGTAVAALSDASRTQWGATPLPLDLNVLDASGCDFAVSP